MEQLFKVPIRNIFCMLSYVSEYYELVDQLSTVDEELITYDFLAKRFLAETKQLLNRDLLKGYITHTEETSFISGKIMINQSIPFIAQHRPVLVCEKDHYSADILFNQIISTTLINLYKNNLVEEQTRKQCFMLWEEMPQVNQIVLTREMFSRIRFSRHNRQYKTIIHIARLLHEVQLLSHKKGEWSLFTVELSESEMNSLFEKFLLYFYQREQPYYRAGSRQMTWNLKGNQSLLPSMQTDITLVHRRENKRIVIDAKFHKNTFQQNFGKNSFKSENLYQIFTYLMHQPKEVDVRGVLIYPSNDNKELTEHYEWDDRMKIEIYQVNLNNSWYAIKNRLLSVIGE